MPKFSTISTTRLSTCHPDLQRLFNEVVRHYDCTILCGTRGKEEQDKAFREGNSKLKFPKSKHNSTPSKAVDVAPYPLDWNDTKRFIHFAGFVEGVADCLNIGVRWGGDWDSDKLMSDEKFVDLPHFELV
jgi:peptidoglycan LD-endopeptidase CwlK